MADSPEAAPITGTASVGMAERSGSPIVEAAPITGTASVGMAERSGSPTTVLVRLPGHAVLAMGAVGPVGGPVGLVGHAGVRMGLMRRGHGAVPIGGGRGFMPQVLTTYAEEFILKNVIAALVNLNPAGIFAGCKAGLFTNSPTATRASVLLDLVEPLFTGYARSAGVTWTGPFQNPDLSNRVVGSVEVFQATSGTPNDVIMGAFLVDSGGTHLLSIDYFPQPINYNNILQAILYTPELDLAGVINYGNGVLS